MGTLVKACLTCGVSFEKSTQWSAAQWNVRLYCSQPCTGKALSKLYAAQRPPLREKFSRYFDVSGAGCWEWRGTIDGYGYGVIDWNRRRYRAHILALEYDGRPVSVGMIGCHHCDNPRCVRPDHLYVGTPADNARDAKNRNRLRVGDDNTQSKLSASDVREMRRLFTGKLGDFSALARRFGVARPTAANAIKGKTWGHVK